MSLSRAPPKSSHSPLLVPSRPREGPLHPDPAGCPCPVWSGDMGGRHCHFQPRRPEQDFSLHAPRARPPRVRGTTGGCGGLGGAARRRRAGSPVPPEAPAATAEGTRLQRQSAWSLGPGTDLIVGQGSGAAARPAVVAVDARGGEADATGGLPPGRFQNASAGTNRSAIRPKAAALRQRAP